MHSVFDHIQMNPFLGLVLHYNITKKNGNEIDKEEEKKKVKSIVKSGNSMLPQNAFYFKL